MKAIPLWGKLLGGIGLLAAVCVGLAFVPTGDVAYAPIAPFDLDGKITIDGRPAEPLQGRIYLVGVTERRVNLLQRLLLDAGDPDIDFGPAPTSRGSVTGQKDVDAMDEAKRVAAGVAFDMAGDPVKWLGTAATVEGTTPGLPAASVLQPGDIIVSVDGDKVGSSVEALRKINARPPGSRVVLGVRRAGVSLQPTLRTVPPIVDGTGSRSRIGVELSTIALRVVLPAGRTVGIDSGEVVGPSAGLAFTLYLYDALSPGDLLRGRNVVVTGAVAPDGTVLPVGRVRQKAIAAQAANRDLLVVPAQNAAEARAAVEDACGDDEASCIQVVPVRSAQEAVQLLELPDAELTARLTAAPAAPSDAPPAGAGTPPSTTESPVSAAASAAAGRTAG